MNKYLLCVTTSVLLLLHSTLVAAQGVDALRYFYANTDTLQTTFSQKVLDDKGSVTDVLRGQLWLSRPTAFRWEYNEPYVQIMVNDGKKLWMYDVDLAQVTVRDASEALAGAPVWLLNGGPALDAQFILENEDSDDGLDWVRITPREEGGDFSLARMGLKKGLPFVLELLDSLGQRTIIEFENVSGNLNIPAERFRFTPPENVEIVEG